MSKEFGFEFFLDVSDVDEGAVIVNVGKEVGSIREIFFIYYESLYFPGYFGFNWNALLDFLRDLSWVVTKKILIVHGGLPEIADSELKVYLEVLQDSVKSWKGSDEHEIHVFFDEKDRDKVSLMLNC